MGDGRERSGKVIFSKVRAHLAGNHIGAALHTHHTHTHTQLRREVYLFSEHVEKPRSIFEVEGLKCIVCGPAPTERERESERGGGGGGGGGEFI